MPSPDTAVRLDGVYKKFRRGELFDSLRDFVPAMAGRLFRGHDPATLEKKEFWALDNVSFEVKRGEAFGIIGSNGAGKSTILKILSRIMQPTRGSIEINGRLSALIEVSAGFHPDLTGRENIQLNGAIMGMTRAEMKSRFDAIVAFSELEEFIDTPVKRYSSGMFARLGFAVAAHVEPDLLIVDEVLSVGDYLFQQKCVDRMNEILNGGATIIFVSHNLRAVSTLCSRSLLLEHGKVVEIGPSADVVQAYFARGHERSSDESRPIRITSVVVEGARGKRSVFDSGDEVEITVEAEAKTAHADMSVVIGIVDENHYLAFDTCTQRLGAGQLALAADGKLRCTFRVHLHLAEGTYHVNAYLHRYVTNKAFDAWKSASTFFISRTPLIKGVVNLQPELVRVETSAPGEVAQAVR